jgi:dephospho-CoA kinase
VYLIGLTGGIAAGKSAVAARLAERGAVVIDADQLARKAVEPGSPALEQIAARFGPEVITSDGSLNRPALGAIIFADADARAALNDITHPAIGRLGADRMAEATAKDPDAVVVYDVPLLVESSSRLGPFDFDLIVVVVASADTRIARMMELRGLTRDEAERRVNSQATDAERRAVADVVIDSDGSLDETLRTADELWQTVKSRG